MCTWLRSSGQRGISVLPMLLVVFFVVIVAKLLIAIVPVYYEHVLATRVVEQILKDYAHQDKNSDQLQSDLGTRFSINNINLQSSYFVCSRDENSVFHINEDYEIRKNIVGNLDVIIHFKHSYDGEGSAGTGVVHSGN